MPDQSNLVQLALLIRRGQCTLNAVPDEYRESVRILVTRLTDADCSRMAAAQEKRDRSRNKLPIWKRFSS